MKNFNPIDKKRLIREKDHMTTPPRMEGKAKNAGMRPIKKQKRNSK